MSSLLARLARYLTHHWKRGLLAAVIVLVLLGAAAGAGGEAADDFEIPGTESQQALDLFRAHSPAFAGADSTLVFTVQDGTINDPQAKQAIEGALDKVKALPDIASVADPYGTGRDRLAGRQARAGRRPLHEGAAGLREERWPGADRRRRDRGGRQQRRPGRGARRAHRPRLRAVVPGRRARRHRDRLHPAR